ncbi:MAG: sugar nucleotide-binding protein [Planctomycetes bacterium]|jgi:dTDP-4-dehydrorhamnose reductase|nr:sugar nucleotide-binding protein [Planctomycetota bacterium]
MAPLRILVTGTAGFLGGHVLAAVRAAGHTPLATSRRAGDIQVDLTAPGMVAAVAEALRPDLVLHLAAMARLTDCARQPDLAARVNAWLPEQLAERFGARLLMVSTDLVFDGNRAPYGPTDPVAPLSVYGATKADGEERVRCHGGRVARLPLLFGPDPSGRGASAQLRAALRSGPVMLFTNEYRTPLHAADAAAALVAEVVQPDGPPLLHLPGPERVSRFQFGQRFAAAHGLDAALLLPVECQDPERPRDAALVGEWRAARDLHAMLIDA